MTNSQEATATAATAATGIEKMKETFRNAGTYIKPGSIVSKIFGKITDVIVGLTTISLKAFLGISVIVAIIWFTIGRTYVADVTQSYLITQQKLEQEVSSAVQTHYINTGVVNARFTKKFWLVGTPQIAFKSPVVDGYLSAMGEIKFDVDVEGGSSADNVSGIVGLTPAFRSNVSESYQFTGDGISGGFDVIVTDGQAVIENFNIIVNWSLVDKIAEK